MEQNTEPVLLHFPDTTEVITYTDQDNEYEISKLKTTSFR